MCIRFAEGVKWQSLVHIRFISENSQVDRCSGSSFLFARRLGHQAIRVCTSLLILGLKSFTLDDHLPRM
jgi:hypothetical protein